MTSKQLVIVAKLILSLAVILALFVVILGAYTRLTDAGLGCPDWPGCYGHLILPSTKQELTKAQHQYPALPIESRKAWTEMAHRYAAATLGVIILLIASYIFWQRLQKRSQYPLFLWRYMSWQLLLILIGLVILQALLGMWTVTMKLLPVVVMGHLLGGILIFSIICQLRLQISSILPVHLPTWHWWIGLGVILVFCQIALGGWVSANYAGIACIGFPKCNGQWLPNLQFAQAFNLSSFTDMSYQGGVLDNTSRITIQFIHRVGAIVTTAYTFFLSASLLAKVYYKPIRIMAWFAILLVIMQFLLGIMNVVFLLPIKSALAHNGIAALLMAIMLMMFNLTKGRLHDAYS